MSKNTNWALYYRNNRDACISRSLKHRTKYWEYINRIKMRPCVDCGVQYNPWQMDFDHKPGTTKLFNVAAMKYNSRKLVDAEIAKCEIVCANCHRQRTHNRRKT